MNFLTAGYSFLSTTPGHIVIARKAAPSACVVKIDRIAIKSAATRSVYCVQYADSLRGNFVHVGNVRPCELAAAMQMICIKHKRQYG